MFDMLIFLSADDPVKRRVHYIVVLKKLDYSSRTIQLKRNLFICYLIELPKQRSSQLFHDWPVDSDYTKQGLKGSGLDLAYYSPFFDFIHPYFLGARPIRAMSLFTHSLTTGISQVPFPQSITIIMNAIPDNHSGFPI